MGQAARIGKSGRVAGTTGGGLRAPKLCRSNRPLGHRNDGVCSLVWQSYRSAPSYRRWLFSICPPGSASQASRSQEPSCGVWPPFWIGSCPSARPAYPLSHRPDLPLSGASVAVRPRPARIRPDDIGLAASGPLKRWEGRLGQSEAVPQKLVSLGHRFAMPQPPTSHCPSSLFTSHAAK